MNQNCSKRWREASNGRPWPSKEIKRMEKEIKALIHSIDTSGDEKLEEKLSMLMKQKTDATQSLFIRISN